MCCGTSAASQWWAWCRRTAAIESATIGYGWARQTMPRLAKKTVRTCPSWCRNRGQVSARWALIVTVEQPPNAARIERDANSAPQVHHLRLLRHAHQHAILGNGAEVLFRSA